MRKAFTETIIELAQQDPRVLLMTADLGFSVLEPFANQFPDRFFNVGVAEQNMIGLATGLAKEGFIPFVYSMGTFAALRPYEFIRNGPIAHQLMVRIVGVGGGFDYGTAGPTHHSLEDIAVLRAQPGIGIFSPADSAQARTILKSTHEFPGPIYYRLSKDERSDIAELNGRFECGRVQVIQEGTDLCFISTGRITEDVVTAAKELQDSHQSSCGVVVVASLSPAPVEDLRTLLTRYPRAITIEPHYSTGGLGSLVAEVIADHGLKCRLTRLGARGLAKKGLGDSSFLNTGAGLCKNGIVQAAKQPY